METSVLMQRNLFTGFVKQDSKNGFISLNDIEKVGNQQRAMNKESLFSLNSWINAPAQKEFIKELETQFGDVTITKKGKVGGTFAHPFLALDMALAIDPKLKIEVYKWLFDELIKYRNHSGDSYKKMAGALFDNCKNKTTFHKGISKTALMIQDACGVTDWQKASESQLKLRTKIHENIALLCDILRDNNQAIRMGILKSLEQIQLT
jgi:hypothetical protein